MTRITRLKLARLLFAFLYICISFTPALAQGTREAAVSRIAQSDELNERDWVKIFDCEFDSPKDLKKWNVISQWKNANNELQAYVADAVSVHDGCLFLEAQKKDVTYGDKQMHYTSGKVETLKKFDIKYGRYDIRFKVPAGKGMWPAFWLLPSNGSWPPEIDFMEILGHEPQILYVTNHYGVDKNGKHPSHGAKKHEAHPDFSQEFHTLTGIWNEREIVCYVDGKKVSVSQDGVPHEKMYMILNLAVGGDWPGNPDDTTPFPGVMQVDYVRVFKLKNSG